MKKIFLLVLTLCAINAQAGGFFGGGGGGGGAWGTITGTLSDQSDLNTALGLKATSASPTFTTKTTHSYATLSTVPYFNSSKELVSSAVTPTELGYVSGVTSAIQTQLNTKGAGDTTGAASSTSGDFASFSGTGGKTLADNGIGYAYTPSTTFSLAVGATNTITASANLTAFGTQITSGAANTNTTIFGNLIYLTTGTAQTVFGQSIGNATHTFVNGTDAIFGYGIGMNLTSDAGGLNAIFGNSHYGTTLGDRNALMGTNIAYGRRLGQYNAAVGYQVFSTSDQTTSFNAGVGYSALISGIGSSGLGFMAGGANGGNYDIFLGYNSDTTDGSANKLVVGGGNSNITGQIYDGYFGSGPAIASGWHSFVFHTTSATAASNLDASASSLIFAPAQSSGNKAGAPIIFQGSPAGSSGTQVNPEVTFLQLTPNLHVMSNGTAATATSKTSNGNTGTCTIAHSSDIIGQITITPGGTGISTGAICDVNFANLYTTAPICTLTAASANAGAALGADSVYVTSSTSVVTFNVNVALTTATAYIYNYHCFEPGS